MRLSIIKNYGDRESIEEGVIRRGRRPRRITSSEISIILYMIRKPNSIIVLLFIQNNPQFKNIAKTCLPPSMLSSSSLVHVQGCSAPQMFSKQQTSPFELSPCCSCHVFSYSFAQFLLETREMSPFIVLKTKTTQSRLQVFSVNGALTCNKAARHRFIKRKILPNLVISSQLVMVNYACAFSQSELGKYFE